MDHQVILKPGKEKPLRHRHPWVYSGAIDHVTGGEPFPGQIVRVVDSAGGFLAYGYHNSQSQIAVRVLDWNEQAVIDDAWWRQALAAAIGRRQTLRDDPDTTCCRLIYAEADGLPGLIVDRYGDYLVIQSLTAGIDAVKHSIVSIFNDLLHPAAIIERSDMPARELEGLPPAKGILSGSVPPPQVEVLENGLRFAVDL
ncbi:MAG: class I SAM-dependent rRNA methyltransferase, partial [candidate division Zixibacteria bacterium]|nr:class I SAM-dependent rRNA methyltransferase [candidate division Zixibacteria bacterium]